MTNGGGDGSDESDPEEPPDDPSLEEFPLSLDAILDLLANRRRRHLIEYLQDVPRDVGSFEEATKYIITQLAIRTGEQPNHDDVQSSLQHIHIPKLADAGVVEYDIRSQELRYRQNERLETLFEAIRDFETD